ncbi:MAG: hypothetical protein R3F29_02260 [Planctomycetota bacterium]
MHALVVALCLVSCGEPASSAVALRERIEVRGVGPFSLQQLRVGGDTYHHYLLERPGSGVEPLKILIYPERDVVSEAYAAKIKAAVDKVAAAPRPLVARAERLIRELMGDYGLEVPEEFASLVEAQCLTHLKVEESGVEVIYDTCPFFPNFDLNAKLDRSLEICDVWFDG